MYSVKVSTLPAKELPMHRRVFAREIWGPGTGAMKCTVLHNVILADGLRTCTYTRKASMFSS